MATEQYLVEFYSRNGERVADQPNELVEGTLADVEAYAREQLALSATVYAVQILDADGSTVGGVSRVDEEA